MFHRAGLRVHMVHVVRVSAPDQGTQVSGLKFVATSLCRFVLPVRTSGVSGCPFRNN